jgi:hypothetical protein
MGFLLAAVNLLMAGLYPNNSQIQSVARDRANKYLGTKDPKFNSATVEFLSAILERDLKRAAEALGSVCKEYGKAKWIHSSQSPALKCFGIIPHGLHHWAYHVRGEEWAGQIQIPESPYFWKDYTELVRKNGFKQGSPFLNFTGALEPLNKIYEH